MEPVVAGKNKKMWVVLGSTVVCLAACLLFYYRDLLTIIDGGGRQARARHDLEQIEKALETFCLQHGFYPSDLKGLCERQPDGGAALLDKQTLTDPWGQPYEYNPGNPPAGLVRIRERIYSLGRPGQNRAIMLRQAN